MKDKKWDVGQYPVYVQPDVSRRNRNIDLGNELCERCDGTGNELYSMYGRCRACDGTGAKT